MDENGLTRLEELCSIVYGGQPTVQKLREEAHKTLLALQTSSTFLPQIKFLISNAKSPYSLLYGINSLLEIVTKDWKRISSQNQQELVPFLLNFLAGTQQNPLSALNANFIIKGAVRCLCRVTRQGWLSNESFQHIFSQVKQLLRSGSRKHVILGLQILAQLVIEFDVTNNEHSTSSMDDSSSVATSWGYRLVARYDASRRMLSQAFKEHNGLTQAFMLGLEYVEKGQESGDQEVVKEALNTLHVCLMFDFVGTGQDTTDETVNCIYIPVEWAEHIARAKSLRQIFQIYQTQWASVNSANSNQELISAEDGSASLCLQILTLLVAVRRSVFDTNTRREFLVVLLEGTTTLMQSKTGLTNSEACLHHFCRLLAAIKSHFTLVDLTQPKEYHPWLQELAKFTTDVLHAWGKVSNRTVHYIIKLWASLVLPTPYLQVRDGYRHSSPAGRPVPPYLQGLDTYVPDIVAAFVRTRCDMCAAAVGNEDSSGGTIFGSGPGFFGVDGNLLDEEGLLLDTLIPVSVLVRFKYTQAANVIAGLYNDALNNYKNFMSNLNSLNNSTSGVFFSIQARLTFLNYLIGAIVGSHVSRVSTAVIENFDQNNTDLTALAFSLINSMNNVSDNVQSLPLLDTDCTFKLELSCLYFVRCFQNLYIESRARNDADNEPKGLEYSSLQAFGFPNAMYDSIGSQARRRSARPTERKEGEMADDEDQTGEPSVASGHSQIQRLQENISSKFGVSVLDMALQKVFRLLSKMSSSDANSSQISPESSHRVILTEKALSVLHQLSIGVTVVHAGRSFTPKLMSSGKLLLESKTIQSLLTNPDSRNFPLLTNPTHSKSRIFLMATLAKLLFTQIRIIPSQGITLDLNSFANSGKFDMDSFFQEINSVIFSSGANLNNMSSMESRSQSFGDDGAEVVIVSGEGLISLNHLGSLSSIQRKNTNGANFFGADFYKRRQITRQEVCDILFVQFMKPLSKSCEQIFQFLQNMEGSAQQLDITSFSSPDEQRGYMELKKAVLTLFRDLKGILTSCSISREYELLFSWLFPSKVRILAAVAKILWQDDEIIAALFKFLKDLVHNKGSRINFGSSYNTASSSGTVLFKESCNIVVSYISQKIQFFNEIRHKDAQKKDISVKQNMSNDNILKDLSLITGLHNQGSNTPNEMNPSNVDQFQSSETKFQNEGLLSMSALREAVMNLEDNVDASSSSFSLSNTRKKAAMGSRNAIDLDFGAAGVGITIDISKLADSNPNDKTISIISAIVEVLSRLLSGRFANLASFDIYQDNCLKEAISRVLEIAFIAEPHQIVSYPKLTNNVIELLYLLCSNNNFLLQIVQVTPGLLARIVATLGEVINIEDNYADDTGKSGNLEDLATSVANEVNTENNFKYKYSQYKTIIGKAATALQTIVDLRCRAVAFNYVIRDVNTEGPVAEAVFNTKLSFLSLELRNELDPDYRPSLASASNSSQSFSHSVLSAGAECFIRHNENMPKLFPELLTLILSKLFVFPSRESSQNQNEVNSGNEMQSDHATAGTSSSTKIYGDGFVLRGNAKKIAKTLLPLILTAPHTFELFKNKVLMVHANSAEKRGVIEGRFSKIFEVLKPAITTETSGTVGPNPAFFEPLLRQNEDFAKEMCKLAKELSST